jgi:hypothetical protein
MLVHNRERRIFDNILYEVDSSDIPGYRHHNMARPLVAGGKDGPQQWMLPANILNKQPRTNDKRRSSSLGFGREANNPSP